jgi:hypothetical protein
MSDCIGCQQAAIANEAEFQRVEREAIKYVEEKQTPVRIYKEFQEWKFIRLDIAVRENIPGRKDVHGGQMVSVG